MQSSRPLPAGGGPSWLLEGRLDDMHYPHRLSKIKRKRKSGFLVRMRTHNGRKLINRKRRVGRRVSVA
jgi:large subunit ribosomal protein L34